MKKLDFISIGDTTLDVFLELDIDTKVIKKGNVDYLGVVFAEKIPIKKFTSVPAVGNSANVAIGTSRLGLNTAFYTILGNDGIGHEMADILKKEKIAKDYVVFDKKRPSNFSAVLNYKAERTILVHHEHRDYNLPKMTPPKWVYYSSLAAGHDKLHAQIPAFVKKTKANLGFNPGSFQIREGIKKLKPIIKECTVLFVNRNEAQDLVGKTSDIKKLLVKLYDLGTKIVVITDGPKGSYTYDGKTFLFLKIFPAHLVERTGAGDAYSTGFLSALAQGNKVSDAMRWGTFSSASVIQYIGAREGLLSKKEMNKVVKANPKHQPKEL